jgi:hypothetical protein
VSEPKITARELQRLTNALPADFLWSDRLDAYTLREILSALAWPELLEALQMLYAEQVDYITLNHLGDPHHNQSMKLARAALSQSTEAK